MRQKNKKRILAALLGVVTLSAGCATSPPGNPDNICSIFREKKNWYGEARAAADKWGSPVAVIMAILHQESHFVQDARPPRSKILGFIPGPRPSDAYGYAQALGSTWRGYQRSTSSYSADRDDFSDAVDFVGWYNNTSARQCQIRSNDTYHLYLAYHEGHGGFNRRSFKSKAWLQKVSHKVSARAQRYQQQLNSCERSLRKRKKFLGLF